MRRSPPGTGYLAYDTRRDMLVAYLPYANMLWEFDGFQWEERTLASSSPQPPSVLGAAFAYDEARGVCVLFGGAASGSASSLTSTWEYDGAHWTERPLPAAGPTPRRMPSMVYDSTHARLVIYGGNDLVSQSGSNRQTWAYDGASWTLLDSSGPNIGTDIAIACDSVRDRIVALSDNLYGMQTWEFDGAHWSQRLITGPSARSGGQMAYFPGIHQCIYAGGSNQSDTWSYDGSTWTRQVSGMPPRIPSKLVYDSLRQAITFVGGDSLSANGLYTVEHRDLWRFNGASWTNPLSDGPTTALAEPDDWSNHTAFVPGLSRFEAIGMQANSLA
ncbi:MAG TPA: hypothetical protein VHC70_14945, partial [Phycisphaerales bacterium]|nr:hypothetical protein [Phycisphaerales bacterium]